MRGGTGGGHGSAPEPLLAPLDPTGAVQPKVGSATAMAAVVVEQSRPRRLRSSVMLWSFCLWLGEPGRT